MNAISRYAAANCNTEHNEVPMKCPGEISDEVPQSSRPSKHLLEEAELGCGQQAQGLRILDYGELRHVKNLGGGV